MNRYVRHLRLRAESGIVLALLAVVLLSGCGGSAAGESKSTPTPAAPTSVAAEDANVVCADSDVTIGDLPNLTAEWDAAADDVLAEGREWQDDAVLVELEPVCLIETRVDWLATFYSEDANLWNVNGMEVEDIKRTQAFAPADVDFGALHGWLSDAGYRDELPFLVFQISPFHAPDGDKSRDLFAKIQISFEDELYMMEVNLETGEITDH